MLTAAEAAKILGLSAQQVYKLAQARKITHYRFETALRFDEADLRAFAPERFRILSARDLRTVEQTRQRIPEAERPPSRLTPEQLAIAQKRERRQKMPPWGERKKILAVYTEARRLTRDTGIPHHVDHVIPLRGEFVSGLHVHTNMQILTGSENSKKRNRYEP